LARAAVALGCDKNAPMARRCLHKNAPMARRCLHKNAPMARRWGRAIGAPPAVIESLYVAGETERIVADRGRHSQKTAWIRLDKWLAIHSALPLRAEWSSRRTLAALGHLLQAVDASADL